MEYNLLKPIMKADETNNMELEEKEQHTGVTAVAEMNLDESVQTETETEIDDRSTQDTVKLVPNPTGQTTIDQYVDGSTQASVELPDGATWYLDYRKSHGKMKASMKKICKQYN